MTDSYDEQAVERLLSDQLSRVDDPDAERVLLFGVPVEDLSRRHLIAGIYLAMELGQARDRHAEQERALFWSSR